MSTKKYNVKKQKRKSFTRSKNKRRSKRTKKFKVKRKLYGGSEAAAGQELKAVVYKYKGEDNAILTECVFSQSTLDSEDIYEEVRTETMKDLFMKFHLKKKTIEFEIEIKDTIEAENKKSKFKYEFVIYNNIDDVIYIFDLETNMYKKAPSEQSKQNNFLPRSYYSFYFDDSDTSKKTIFNNNITILFNSSTKKVKLLLAEYALVKNMPSFGTIKDIILLE